MKKIISIILLIILMLPVYSGSIYALNLDYNLEKPEIQGDSVILMDVYTGSVLFEKDMDKREFPASITKIMTALIALEKGSLTDNVTVSETAVAAVEPGSNNIALKPGETLTLEQLLYAALIESANDAANVIAEHIGGTIEGFAAMMNERAAGLGCKNTNFTNPSGLHDDNHYTTAYDMALIAREAYKNEKYREIIAAPSYEIPATNLTSSARTIYIKNQMKKPPSIYVYDGCEGGKNGFTDEAQNTLVTYAARDGLGLLAVTLKETGANAYIDSIALYDYGFANFKRIVAFDETKFSDSIPAVQEYKEASLEAGQVSVAASNGILYTVPNYVTEADITINAEYTNNPAKAPIAAGDALGTAHAVFNGDIIGSAQLIAASAAAAPQEAIDEQDKLEARAKAFALFKKIGIGLLIAIVVIILLLFIIGIASRSMKKRRRRRRKSRYRTYSSSSYGNTTTVKRNPSPTRRNSSSNGYYSSNPYNHELGPRNGSGRRR